MRKVGRYDLASPNLFDDHDVENHASMLFLQCLV